MKFPFFLGKELRLSVNGISFVREVETLLNRKDLNDGKWPENSQEEFKNLIEKYFFINE